MIKPQTLKGFRDFLPEEARKRSYVIKILSRTFESFGFEPLETPALEYAEVLLGKYGTEGDKLLYRFKDRGDRDIALRYDQTVPLARVVAQYSNHLPTPFKRYQIQPVWRAENTQKGRYREFLQCDADIVGSAHPIADSETIAVAAYALKSLGFSTFQILINNRQHFSYEYIKTDFDIPSDKLPFIIRAVDKLAKVGPEEVKKEITTLEFSLEEAGAILEGIQGIKPCPDLQAVLDLLPKWNLPQEWYRFDPTLARGLDYYTGMIFEAVIPDYTAGSVCGGGRYDNLIGMFTEKSIPAVGFAFGFDRLIDALETLGLFPDYIHSSPSQVLVTVFSEPVLLHSLSLFQKLREHEIVSELYELPSYSLDKQLKYANRKGIPYVAIIGPDEAKNGTVTLKHLPTRTQKTLSIEKIIEELKKQKT